MSFEMLAAGGISVDDPQTRPSVMLMPGRHRRAEGGHPWIYSNEVRMDAGAKALSPGALVTLRRADGSAFGVGMFNPYSLLAARLLDRDFGRAIGRRFFARRIERLILEALDALLTPAAIVLRNDSPARALEGLPRETRMAKSTLDGPILIHENGAAFGADLLGGQKTGWFFDQRDNRRFVAALARDARVLDLYCFTGGFAVQAARAGAAAVLGVDSSAPALDLAADAARRNGLGEICAFRAGDAF